MATVMAPKGLQGVVVDKTAVSTVGKAEAGANVFLKNIYLPS